MNLPFKIDNYMLLYVSLSHKIQIINTERYQFSAEKSSRYVTQYAGSIFKAANVKIKITY